MGSYSIQWKNTAIKELKKLPGKTINNILSIISSLSENPLPAGCIKISGAEQTYRIRTGDYRIVYTVLHGQLVIEIIRIGHRKDVYRNL
jgi:mRNA interferase RelE/StbE